MKVLERLVELVEDVGEVLRFDIGDRVRPKVVLVAVQPPSDATGSPVPDFPRVPY